MTTNSINNSSSDLTVSNIELSGSTISTVSTNSNLILSPNGTGNVFLPGISFDSGTNVLNNYIPVTTFTPAISFGGGTTGITYDPLETFAKYYKIGNQIYYSIIMKLTSKGSSTGTARVLLPTALTSDANNPVAGIRLSFVNLTGINYAILDLSTITSNAANIVGIVNNASSITLDNTYFNNNSIIGVSGFYWV